jgi:predicted small secreted protein
MFGSAHALRTAVERDTKVGDEDRHAGRVVAISICALSRWQLLHDGMFRHQRKLFMRRKLSMAFIALVVLGGATPVLAACNTVEGAGKDVSKAGHEVSEEAKEHK